VAGDVARRAAEHELAHARVAVGPHHQEPGAELSDLFEDHRRHDLPSFRGEYVEGAARGRRVHHLHADPGVGQRSGQSRVRKAQARASTEDHDLGLELGQRGEISFGQRLEPAGSPAGPGRCRGAVEQEVRADGERIVVER